MYIRTYNTPANRCSNEQGCSLANRSWWACTVCTYIRTYVRTYVCSRHSQSIATEWFCLYLYVYAHQDLFASCHKVAMNLYKYEGCPSIPSLLTSACPPSRARSEASSAPTGVGAFYVDAPVQRATVISSWLAFIHIWGVGWGVGVEGERGRGGHNLREHFWVLTGHILSVEGRLYHFKLSNQYILPITGFVRHYQL